MTKSSQPSNTPSATLYLRLEGPLQSWGSRTIGRFRRTESVPTKSGVVGLLGAALGLSRQRLNDRLEELNRLTMAVRVDRAGHVEEDYQTVGARIGVLAADGKVKKTAATGEFETIISPREYLIDASFLVALHGDHALVEEIALNVKNPKWPLFLGRKRCVPGTRVFAGVEAGLTLAEAVGRDGPADHSLLEPDESEAVRVVTDLIDADRFGSLLGIDSNDLETCFEMAKSYVTDRLIRLDPQVHGGRIVLDFEMQRPDPKLSKLDRPNFADPLFGLTAPQRPQRASDPDARKAARAKSCGLCVFCGFQPPDPRKLHAHHLTYVRRGRERVTDDLESIEEDDFVMLCGECHAAVSMLEYQKGFGLERIDPRDPRWHARIVSAREARRRYRNPAHPRIGSVVKPRSEANGEPLDLVESIIPVLAGSSYSTDSPGTRWLANRHHVHQRLSMAFPDESDRLVARGYGVTRDEGGFLYRIESGPVTRIIVRSRIIPDWGRAFAKAAWLVKQDIPRPRLLDLTAFTEGVELRFDLEANPIKRLRADGPEGKRGSRVPLRDDNALNQWMDYRASDSGFDIIRNSLRIERLGRQTARMKAAPNRHWDSVRFTGCLRIVDAARFRMALTNGIGPAKAFGFGLLSIAAG